MSDGNGGEGDRAIELLQQVGLKEYESRTFVALTAMPEGTAREVSERSEVPRPRVYDAMRVLESKGLVETKHGTPQRFRAVAIDDAVHILRAQYESRFDALDDALRSVESEPRVADQETQEVWTINGEEAVSNRTITVVDGADREVVLLVADEAVLSERLLTCLEGASERGVEVFIGVLDGEIQETIERAVPRAQVFRSGLNWLQEYEGEEETRIGRFLLADRNVLLVSSLGPHDSPKPESAIWAEGVGNGLVVIARRMLKAGLSDRATDGETE